ncbi:MAG: phosphohexomutase domain-containing protein [Planctomycetota bacterium]
MSIYKPCDIRGNAAEELTPALYRAWGRLLGNRVEPGAKFVVGGDVRRSTPEFLAALIGGLCQSGVDVVDLGLLPTPMIHYARDRLRAAGCAIVTASHNPAEINGLKWMIGDVPPTEEDVEALRPGVETPGPQLAGRLPTTPRSLDVSFDYVAWLQETWVEAIWGQRHVVLDPMHGCWARRARRYLQAVFPQCLFSAVHDEPDAAFCGRSPDCSRPQLLEELCETVYRQRAHLGLAFDGDGDRVALVDDKGLVLSAEEATWCLLQSFGTQLRNEPFVYDLKFSDRVPEAARQLGAEPVAERSGHTFIRARMLQTGALFGAEVSGHYFFRALRGGDDGLYTACRLIAHLAQSGETLSELRRECPGVFMTPDLRVALAPERQQRVIDRVRAAWSEHPQTTIDGVRVDFPDGWALVRSSVTEPALTVRFEASDLGWLEELVRRFCGALDDVGDELWARYEAAMGGRT